MPPGMEAMTVEIHLDKSSGLPTRMLTSTAKGVFMTMDFHKIEKLTTVDPALFVYTPPSDVPVVDMDKVYADRDHHHE
jgi:outer membrane lipoprotein-sorting protein